jgi:hypothetical protein
MERTFRRKIMKHTHLTRRAFMALATGGAIVTILPGCTSEVRLQEKDKRALLRMARLLYPHDALPDRIYSDVLQPLFVQASQDRVLATELHAGFETLTAAAGGDWQSAPMDNQLEALESIEDGAFFEVVQNAVRTQIYEHREVWKLISYEGSSVEHGGYINRGFDDIDWLPED